MKGRRERERDREEEAHSLQVRGAVDFHEVLLGAQEDLRLQSVEGGGARGGGGAERCEGAEHERGRITQRQGPETEEETQRETQSDPGS